MPSKRQSQIEDPPSASSTDDGSEEQSGEEQSGSEEEEESSPPHKNAAPLQTSAQKPPTNPKNNKQVPLTQPSSDEDSDDEDDASSDEEAPNKQPVPNLKPTEVPKSKKSSMNATTDTNFAAPSGTKTTASKRPLEPEKTEKESKSQKKKKVAEVTEEDGHTEEADKKIVVAALTGGDQKKNAFARVWTEEDEIALIRAMLSFAKKGKNVASSNVEELYDITKGSFTFDANRGQLANKIRSVKSKYQSHWHKAKDGEEPHFKNPHDEKTFQLCKKLWGKVEVTEGNGNDAKGKGKGSISNKSSNGVASPKKKSSNSSEVKVEVKEDAIDEEDLDEFGYTNLAFTIGKDLMAMPAGLANLFTKKNLRHIEISKRKELESRWRQLFDKENELLFERMDLVREMTHLMKK